MNRKEFSAEFLVHLFENRDIEPDQEFEAASGRDFGLVQAWSLDDEQYVVKWGDNGTINWDFAEGKLDETTDLGCWLIYELQDPWDLVIQETSVYDRVTPEIADNTKAYRVLKERQFYGPCSRFSWATDDKGLVVEFESLDDAYDWVEDAERFAYVLDHNESSGPEYTVIGR